MYIHTVSYSSVVTLSTASLEEKQSYLSRWQLSIQPWGRWMPRRKPLSSSLPLSLNLYLTPFLRRLSTTPCRPFCMLFFVLLSLFSFSPRLTFSLSRYRLSFTSVSALNFSHAWGSKSTAEDGLEAWEGGSEVVGTENLGTNFKTTLLWSDANALPASTCWTVWPRMQAITNPLAAQARLESIYVWPDWGVILTSNEDISSILTETAQSIFGAWVTFTQSQK